MANRIPSVQILDSATYTPQQFIDVFKPYNGLDYIFKNSGNITINCPSIRISLMDINHDYKPSLLGTEIIITHMNCSVLYLTWTTMAVGEIANIHLSGGFIIRARRKSDNTENNYYPKILNVSRNPKQPYNYQVTLFL